MEENIRSLARLFALGLHLACISMSLVGAKERRRKREREKHPREKHPRAKNDDDDE